MKRYFKLWKDLREEVGLNLILEGLVASMFYTLLVFIPSVLIFAQVISMFYHLLYFWVAIIIVATMFISTLQLWLWKKTIYLSFENLNTDIKFLFKIQNLIHFTIIIIIAIVFIFVLIPSMQI